MGVVLFSKMRDFYAHSGPKYPFDRHMLPRHISASCLHALARPFANWRRHVGYTHTWICVCARSIFRFGYGTCTSTPDVRHSINPNRYTEIQYKVCMKVCTRCICVPVSQFIRRYTSQRISYINEIPFCGYTNTIIQRITLSYRYIDIFSENSITNNTTYFCLTAAGHKSHESKSTQRTDTPHHVMLSPVSHTYTITGL